MLTKHPGDLRPSNGELISRHLKRCTLQVLRFDSAGRVLVRCVRLSMMPSEGSTLTGNGECNGSSSGERPSNERLIDPPADSVNTGSAEKQIKMMKS